VKSINPIKRTHSLVWGTSNGDFKTNKVGSVDINFTENKIFSVEPDIIMLDKHTQNPAFDMILEVDTLREFGVILNFAESTITIDHHEVIMRPLDAFNCVKTRRHVLKRELRNTQQGTFSPGAPADPVSDAEATDRTMEIIDTTYKKADLPKVIRENCDH